MVRSIVCLSNIGVKISLARKSLDVHRRTSWIVEFVSIDHDSINAIDGINAVMVNAYKLNNPGGPTMNIQSFASETDLNSYVTQTNYR